MASPKKLFNDKRGAFVVKNLESRGFEHVGTWQFETAKNLIDRIAANGWRIPMDINPREYKGA